MKKPKDNEFVIAKKREKKSIRRKLIKSGKKRKKTNKRYTKCNKKHISFPKIFCIYFDPVYNSANDLNHDTKKYKETMDIINKIKKFTPSNKFNTLVLNFSLCERISAAALLLLYSSIENYVIKYNQKVEIYRLPRDNKVTKLLKRTGFIKLCNQQDTSPDFSSKSMPILTGVGGEFRDEIVDFIQNKIYENQMSTSIESSFSDAIQETISNVTRHAYPKEDKDNKKWWLICDLYEDELNLAIYDNGVGIPVTVVDKNWFKERISLLWPNLNLRINELILDEISKSNFIDKQSLKNLSDWDKINIAMYPDMSSTRELKHGQGSKSITALVKKNNGNLIIYSNKGLYFSNNDKRCGRNLEHSISGTLIQWNITVAKQNDDK